MNQQKMFEKVLPRAIKTEDDLKLIYGELLEEMRFEQVDTEAIN